MVLAQADLSGEMPMLKSSSYHVSSMSVPPQWKSQLQPLESEVTYPLASCYCHVCDFISV